MKFVIFSDIHLHTWQSEMSEEYRIPTRLVEQKNVLQQVIDIAIQNEATILFGGDIVHAVGKVPVEVLNVVYWFFEECKRCGIPLYSAVGNHDLSIRHNTSKYHSVLTPFQDLEERNKTLAKMNIQFVDYDDTDYENVKNSDIVILHKQPALVNQYHHKMEGVNWKALESNNRLLFYGHDHTLRVLSEQSRVIGCPMHLTRSDAGQDRGCWIVDSKDWSVEFVKLQYSELKIHSLEEKKEEEVVFEAKIKGVSFEDILAEWLVRQEKPAEYLNLIKDDLTSVLQVVKPFFTGKIKNLSIDNLFSIEHLELDFKDCLNLVIGKNGSGKSSIFEALSWVLFEETTKGLAKTEVVRDRPTKQKDGSAELVLDGGDSPYIIKRSVKNGLEVYQGDVLLTEGMGKLQAQDFLEKNILGFNRTVYMAACYFSQEQLTMLAQLGDADTTNMVTNLLGFETYDVLYDKMEKQVKTCSEAGQFFFMEQQKVKQDLSLKASKLSIYAEQLEVDKSLTVSIEEDKNKVTQQLSELTTLYGNIVVPSVTVESHENSLLALKGSKSEISNKGNLLGLELEKVHNTQHQLEKDEIKFNNELKLISNEVTRHNENIRKLENREVGQRCTHCGALVTKENVQTFIDEEIAEIKKLSSPKEIPVFKSLMEDQYALEAEFISQLNDCNIQVGDIDVKIAEIQKQKEETLADMVKATVQKETLTLQLKNVESNRLRINDALENNLKMIETKSKAIKELTDECVNLDSAIIDLTDKEKRILDNRAIYEFWKSSFSNKGIRPLLLDKFCHTFNQIVKPLCKQVSGGKFNIEFSPTATTRGGQERNKLGLNIIYKDKTVLYQGLSGGEKTRVNIPLCFGLNKFISDKYNVKGGLLGVIILDEIFANLDSDGEEDIAAFLWSESKNKFIGVITHSDELKSYSNNVWQVTKVNDVTNVEVV